MRNKIFVTVSISWVLFSVHVFAQNNNDRITGIPEFKNQGEQEVYWAKQLFKKQYKEQQFEVFSGKVISANNAFIFSGDSLHVNNISVEIRGVFLKGLLYPALIGVNVNLISDIEELKFVEESPQRRRFKFLSFQKGFSNPMVCFFELTDINATQATGLIEFIRDSKLTFFKQGWVMI